ncbi:hypothetical protein ACFLX2_00515 [Candidatus Dependentiae bacterium]
MNIKQFNLTPILAMFFSWYAVAYFPSTVLPCTIEFPKVVKDVPQVCIYHEGERFACEIDKEGKRVCFTIPVDRGCTTFHLLVTSNLQCESSEENTVQYLKTDSEQPYKFYKMKLVRALRKRYCVPSEKNKKPIEDRWEVSQKELGKEGRIPDEAIIVLLNAEYVDNLKADKGFELPTIVIKNNVLEIAGSESKLHDNAIKLLLSSLDYNPLHSTNQVHTKQEKQKIIIAMSDSI